MKYLVFDTETSDLPKTKIVSPEKMHLYPYVVQFSYIIYDQDTNTKIKIFDKIIKLKPYNVISKDSTKFHGITNEISELKGVSLKDVLTEFLTDIDSIDCLVAHNKEFDLKMIMIELMRLIEDEIVPELKLNWENKLAKVQGLSNVRCTMRDSIDLCKIEKENSRGKYYKFPTLSELHMKLFMVEPKNLHNSLNDILITLRCFIQMTYNEDVFEKNQELKELIIGLL